MALRRASGRLRPMAPTWGGSCTCSAAARRPPRRALSSLADWLPAGMLAPAAPPVAVSQHTQFPTHRQRSAVWRNVLPPELLSAVVDSATTASLLEEDVNVLESTFQRTRWLPAAQLAAPRTPIEAAVAHLQRHVSAHLRASSLDPDRL